MFRSICLALAATCAAVSAPVQASEPITAEVYVGGFSLPLEFVQSTADDNIQYIVQQGGLIRVIQDGNLLPGSFLNLAPRISQGGERGLLGMALDPDFANNGRFYLDYTNPAGNTHITRYTLQSDGMGGFNPLLGDFASEEILLAITQDFPNHNGGNMRMGPDGFLYISMGDGGSGGDPFNRAQTRSQFLGKILRIDISTATGYAIPASNPYVGHATFQEEIWAYGVRNVWKFTFDMGPCGTNGMFLADVGQVTREEVSYEPASEGGRNYGWKCREGLIAFSGCSPPAGESFTEPIFDYATGGFGRSITGGYMYRGTEMVNNRGRYYYADFVSGRVASYKVDFTMAGEGVASDGIDHTTELNNSIPGSLTNISSFGRDADGELYILSYNGNIYRIRGTVALGDADRNSVIDSTDLAILLAAWGSTDCGVADLNNDENVDSGDLAILLAGWG